MEYINISKIKPHPKNNYFFDDMVGENWEKFLNSIRISGIKEPIILTQDNVVVSGHQRIRAAKKLKIQQVPYIKYTYETDDDVIRDLIELNIRQRGIMADSETKAGRRFKELKRIYEIKKGGSHGNQYSFGKDANCVIGKTMDQIANENRISKSTINRTIQVANADPLLQEWNIDGKISGDTVRYIMANMSKEEREEFYRENEDVKNIRKKDAEKFKKKTQELYKQINDLQETEKTLRQDNEALAFSITSLKDSTSTALSPITTEAELEEYKNIILELQKSILEKDTYIKKLETDAETFNNAAYLERSSNGTYRTAAGTEELYKLGRMAKELLEHDLAPLKFRRCFERVQPSQIARNNLTQLVNLIESWCHEMYAELAKVEDDIIDA